MPDTHNCLYLLYMCPGPALARLMHLPSFMKHKMPQQKDCYPYCTIDRLEKAGWKVAAHPSIKGGHTLYGPGESNITDVPSNRRFFAWPFLAIEWWEKYGESK